MCRSNRASEPAGGAVAYDLAPGLAVIPKGHASPPALVDGGDDEPILFAVANTGAQKLCGTDLGTGRDHTCLEKAPAAEVTEAAAPPPGGADADADANATACLEVEKAPRRLSTAIARQPAETPGLGVGVGSSGGTDAGTATGNVADEFVSMGADYNENSATQSAGATIVAGHLAKYASAATGTPVRVGEYGCATGGSTLEPLAAIQRVCPAAAARMEVYLNDLPLNSWGVTKETVEPQFPAASFRYVKRCMYQSAIVRPGALNLGYTVFAQHWLSKGVPTKLSGDSVWGNQLPQGDALRARWAAQSAEDWARFLTLRAEEFAPGGTLVAFVQSSKLDGSLSERFAATVADAKARLVADGGLTAAEAAKLAMPEYLKSTQEILAPFTASGGAAASLWDIKELQMSELPCPYRAQFDAGELTRDELVEAQVGNLRSFMNNSLAEALKGAPGAADKLEMLWEHVRRLGLATLGALDTNYTYHIVVLQRRPAAQ